MFSCWSGVKAVRFSGRHEPIPGGFAAAIQAAETRKTDSSHSFFLIGCVSVVIRNNKNNNGQNKGKFF